MKALKNESSLYVEQVESAIIACCESNDKPSTRALMELYTLIGRCICRQGEKAFVAHLAEMIAIRFPLLKGFSLRNLRRMRDFYHAYANDPALMEKTQSLSWTQNNVILECCKVYEQRSFYIGLAAERNLSKLALMKAIEENTFDALSNEESSAETCIAPVHNISPDAGLDTSATIEPACEPSVPACEPLRQGDAVPRSTGRVSVIVSAEVSADRKITHKVDGESPPLGFTNQHLRYRSFLVLWHDNRKMPQKPPDEKTQYEGQPQLPFMDLAVAPSNLIYDRVG